MARSKLKVRKTTDRTPALVISYHITSSALCAQWILSAYLEFVMFYGIVFWGLKCLPKKYYTQFMWKFGLEWYIWCLESNGAIGLSIWDGGIFGPFITVVTNMSKCLWQIWANVCDNYEQMFVANMIKYLRQMYLDICDKYMPIFVC